MFTYEPYENPIIEKANGSSFGNWFIKLDAVTFRFFWKKSEAKTFLSNYLKGI